MGTIEQKPREPRWYGEKPKLPGAPPKKPSRKIKIKDYRFYFSVYISDRPGGMSAEDREAWETMDELDYVWYRVRKSFMALYGMEPIFTMEDLYCSSYYADIEGSGVSFSVMTKETYDFQYEANDQSWQYTLKSYELRLEEYERKLKDYPRRLKTWETKRATYLKWVAKLEEAYKVYKPAPSFKDHHPALFSWLQGAHGCTQSSIRARETLIDRFPWELRNKFFRY